MYQTEPKEQSGKKRKDHFFDDYIKGMLVEAESLGISREEIIDMIASGKRRRRAMSESDDYVQEFKKELRETDRFKRD